MPEPTPDALHPDPAAHGYPRPQLARSDWWSLNGRWEFALDPDAAWGAPEQVTFDREIVVPFAPETPASGVGFTGFFVACWYRRTFEAPRLAAGERLHLHFGALDYIATVWVNGVLVARHEGGYSPFHADITDALRDGPQVVVVRAEDDPHDLAKPRGKQDWQLEPHSIWYPRTSGIWQTVWLEKVPATHIADLRWSSSLEHWEIGLDLLVAGERRDGLRVKVRLTANGRVIADDTYELLGGEVHRRIALSDPGIDDYRNELLWSPDRPTLIDAELQLWGGRGERLDLVESYCAIRQVGVQGDRFLLNARPYYLRLVLDQGYWRETGLTAPSDAALRRDVVLAKSLGFNGVRKHQKIEDPRFLYWADKLGLLVWEEMPSAYRFTRRSIERLTRQWMEAMSRDTSHPCIVAWVPFNESWGVPDLPTMPEQRHWVASLYHLTNTLDTSRPVVGNDGWESVATDIMAIHDYDHRPDRIAKRYHSDEDLPRILERERPGGRRLVVEGHTEHTSIPVMLTEFGGIAYHPDPDRTWGYSRTETTEELEQRYRALLDVVNRVGLFAGFCYTQFTDTYQEANGLLTMDRQPKLPLDVVWHATRGE
ncbi:glycoside hydrolase family 2 sugar binding protein [Gemmatirosa kalamazoonensis]|uniref:Glycoside hydrolase family 2 sugar binding protein n=1 Tax=Gemmatirosa kalamazoonensis TaxID=861299 RepID=W0REA4_9BACT|nr:sugar-binding domain-containing protein [Gemmatirosa kalamazoonensis]AHG89146.1 glycoside hydrolase family 2 sugar binding protein [Gemmatirosa kalamazoonensis]